MKKSKSRSNTQSSSDASVTASGSSTSSITDSTSESCYGSGVTITSTSSNSSYEDNFIRKLGLDPPHGDHIIDTEEWVQRARDFLSKAHSCKMNWKRLNFTSMLNYILNYRCELSYSNRVNVVNWWTCKIQLMDKIFSCQATHKRAAARLTVLNVLQWMFLVDFNRFIRLDETVSPDLLLTVRINPDLNINLKQKPFSKSNSLLNDSHDSKRSYYPGDETECFSNDEEDSDTSELNVSVVNTESDNTLIPDTYVEINQEAGALKMSDQRKIWRERAKDYLDKSASRKLKWKHINFYGFLCHILNDVLKVLYTPVYIGNKEICEACITAMGRNFTSIGSSKKNAQFLAICTILNELLNVQFDQMLKSGEIASSDILNQKPETKSLKMNPMIKSTTTDDLPLLTRIEYVLENYVLDQPEGKNIRFRSTKDILLKKEMKDLEKICSTLKTYFCKESGMFITHVSINQKVFTAECKTPELARNEAILKVYKYLEDEQESTGFAKEPLVKNVPSSESDSGNKDKIKKDFFMNNFRNRLELYRARAKDYLQRFVNRKNTWCSISLVSFLEYIFDQGTLKFTYPQNYRQNGECCIFLDGRHFSAIGMSNDHACFEVICNILEYFFQFNVGDLCKNDSFIDTCVLDGSDVQPDHAGLVDRVKYVLGNMIASNHQIFSRFEPTKRILSVVEKVFLDTIDFCIKCDAPKDSKWFATLIINENIIYAYGSTLNEARNNVILKACEFVSHLKTQLQEISIGKADQINRISMQPVHKMKSTDQVLGENLNEQTELKSFKQLSLKHLEKLKKIKDTWCIYPNDIWLAGTQGLYPIVCDTICDTKFKGIIIYRKRKFTALATTEVIAVRAVAYFALKTLLNITFGAWNIYSSLNYEIETVSQNIKNTAPKPCRSSEPLTSPIPRLTGLNLEENTFHEPLVARVKFVIKHLQLENLQKSYMLFKCTQAPVLTKQEWETLNDINERCEIVAEARFGIKMCVKLGTQVIYGQGDSSREARNNTVIAAFEYIEKGIVKTISDLNEGLESAEDSILPPWKQKINGIYNQSVKQKNSIALIPDEAILQQLGIKIEISASEDVDNQDPDLLRVKYLTKKYFIHKLFCSAFDIAAPDVEK